MLYWVLDCATVTGARCHHCGGLVIARNGLRKQWECARERKCQPPRFPPPPRFPNSYRPGCLSACRPQMCFSNNCGKAASGSV